MKRINIRFVVITSTVVTILSCILSAVGQSGILLNLLIIPFEIYLRILTILVASQPDTGASLFLGLAILFHLLGPILIFVLWFIALSILSFIYNLIFKRQTAVQSKEYIEITWRISSFCFVALVITNIIWFNFSK
jgi:hypothetical protein